MIWRWLTEMFHGPPSHGDDERSTKAKRLDVLEGDLHAAERAVKRIDRESRVIEGYLAAERVRRKG